MPTLSLNNCSELIRAILVADSQEAVKTIVNNAIAVKEAESTRPGKIPAFIDLNIHQLGAMNPMAMNSTQWSNINMARIHFSKIKRRYDRMPCKA